MTQDQIRARVRDFIMKRFPVARDKGLSDDDSLMRSGAVDSLGILDLVAFMESEFDFELTDDELQEENFDCIASLATLVESKVGVAGPVTGRE